jgi:hypothetical protein
MLMYRGKKVEEHPDWLELICIEIAYSVKQDTCNSDTAIAF